MSPVLLKSLLARRRSGAAAGRLRADLPDHPAKQNANAQHHRRSHPMPDQPQTTPAPRGSLRKRLALLALGLLLVYLAAAYLLMPALWKRYEHRHPSLEHMPGITYTGNGIPGDPLNVALIGTKAEVIQIML